MGLTQKRDFARSRLASDYGGCLHPAMSGSGTAALPASRESAARFSARPDGAFTLLGLSVVLFALSVGFALVVPAFQHARRVSRARETMADLRQFKAAFERYAHDHGDWPPTVTAPGAIPAGMESALAGTHWTAPTPLGGRYVWLLDSVQRGQHFRAAIGIVTVGNDEVTDDRRDLNRLLAAAQNDGLEWHRLRLGFRNEPVYVLEQ